MWFFLTLLLYSTRLCSSLAPTKVERIGILNKYVYPNFVIIDDRSQRQFQSFISSAHALILSNFLNNLPKTQTALQILQLHDRGLYELILLTQANNFNNKVIIIKPNPSQYSWMNKNLYFNGLENDQTLYHLRIGQRNSIQQMKTDKFNLIDRLFYPAQTCRTCSTNYSVQTNFTYIFNLHWKKEQTKALHLFTAVSSVKEGRNLRKQIEGLFKRQETVEVVLELTTTLARIVLIPIIHDLKVYSIGLKIEEKTTSLQLKLVHHQKLENVEGIEERYPYDMLDIGIYYITKKESFLRRKQH